jgi:hypothetical protein
MMSPFSTKRRIQVPREVERFIALWSQKAMSNDASANGVRLGTGGHERELCSRSSHRRPCVLELARGDVKAGHVHPIASSAIDHCAAPQPSSRTLGSRT